ncbi:MAG: MFS transporter [Actinomycetota bacterium]
MSRWPVIRALLRNRRFRRLLAVQGLSQASDGLYQIAVAAVVIFDVSAAETPAQVTKVLAVTILPFSLIGPFTGPFIDRFSRRSILVGASVLRVLITISLVPAIAGPEWVLLLLAVANVSVNRFFHSGKAAVLPTLVEPETYLVANAVSTTVGMVSTVVGGVAGGLVADVFSPVAAVIAATAMIVGAGAVAATIRLPRGEKRGLAGILSELRDDLRDVADGLRVLRSRPWAVYGVGSIWTMRALIGFVLLAALVVLRARFDARATEFSVLLAALGVGGFVGAIAVAPVARRVGYAGIAPLAFLLAGVATLLGGPIPVWPALMATIALGGFAMYATKIAADTLVQRAIPDRYRGRAFAVYDIGYNGAFVVAALIPTVLIPLLGELGIILLTGALYLAGAATLARSRRRLPPEIEVHAYAGARADETPRSVVWNGESLDVAEIERSWHEDRAGRRLLCFQLRLADGRRIVVASAEQGWTLERELAPAPSETRGAQPELGSAAPRRRRGTLPER